MERSYFAEAAKITIPVLFGYTAIGIPFGLMIVNAGYPVWIAPVMSITMYAGAGQYVAVGLFASGAPLGAIAFTELLVNIRHIVYGLSLISRFKNVGAWKPYLIFALTDETYSLLCQAGETEPDQYYFWISFLDYSYWITGSILGAFLGGILPIDTKGIDFVLTALFLTIFTEQWLTVKNHVSALVGIGASVLCLLTLGSQKFLIPAMLLIAALLIGLRQKEGITNE